MNALINKYFKFDEHKYKYDYNSGCDTETLSGTISNKLAIDNYPVGTNFNSAVVYFRRANRYGEKQQYVLLEKELFLEKDLFEESSIQYKEPFNGICYTDCKTCSDSKKNFKDGNVVNPDEVVEKFGADTLRVYEMFMGPFDRAIEWSTDNMVGVRRFIEKIESIGNIPMSDNLRNKNLRNNIGQNAKSNVFRINLKEVSGVRNLGFSGENNAGGNMGNFGSSRNSHRNSRHRARTTHEFISLRGPRCAL